MSSSKVQAVIQYHLERAGENQYKEAFSKQVSVRLGIEEVFKLDRMAESLGLTRTGLATELLEAAIKDAAKVAGVADPRTEGFDAKLLEENRDEFIRRAEEYQNQFIEWAQKNGFDISKDENGGERWRVQ